MATGTFAVQSTWADDFNGGGGGCEVAHSIIDSTGKSAPVVTTYPAATFTAGKAATFTVAATGGPIPAIGETGPLPAGVTLTDNHDGTAALTGSAIAGSDGTYPITLTATNGMGVAAAQNFTLTVKPWSGTIFTVAGDPAGASGNGGDGGLATAASLFEPTSVATDSSGNIYEADAVNNRIRKIDTGGIITNFAGNPSGTGGNTGDGGPASAAMLRSPEGVAVDVAGNVYIADGGNNRVRKVDTHGIITNFAGNPTLSPGSTGDGGPATSATLTSPISLAVDPAGDVYIADVQANQVRKVDPAGTITNFAGSPAGTSGNTGDGGPATAATLKWPEGLAVDSAGNVYLSDAGNNRIRKVDTYGIITNFAGSPTGTGGNTGDGGPANVATLYEPDGLATDATGSLYIADYVNSRVRKIGADGIITNVAGNGGIGLSGAGGPANQATLNGPFSVALDPSGRVLIADTGNNEVREISAPTSPSITSAPAATFTVGVTGSIAITTTGIPAPAVTENGNLPAGVTFNRATQTLSGTAGQATAGTYPITFTAANSASTQTSQNFTLTVDQAAMTYPTDGQANVDTTQPFTWSTIPEAQGYILTVGHAVYGTDLVNSGILAPTTSSFNVPVLPTGSSLHDTLYAKVNGAWTSYQAITFTAAPGQATFTFPLAGQTGADPTKAFTWTTVPHAQGYLLVVGTTKNGTNLVNSGLLPPTQSSYVTPTLPAGKTIYAALFTEVNGTYSRYQAISFTTGAAMATFSHPSNGQVNVTTSVAISWNTIARGQNYDLIIGTTPYGTNLVNSGVLSPTISTYTTSALPHGRVVYATLFTCIDGTWVYQTISFATTPA